MQDDRQEYLIALGGNVPFDGKAPAETLQAGLDRLSAAEGVEVMAVSRFYATPAFPPGSGPEFVNAAARVRAARGPEAFLALLHEVERAFGRERRVRWSARTLDLDLIAAGEAVFPDAQTWQAWERLTLEAQHAQAPDGLVLPHPRLADRAFVLVPLADVAGDWTHPVTGQRVAQMLATLPPEDVANVKPL